MIVYTLHDETCFYFDTLIGIYSTEELARKAKKEWDKRYNPKYYWTEGWSRIRKVNLDEEPKLTSYSIGENLTTWWE